MSERRIHLVAPAAPCGPFIRALQLESAGALIERVQTVIGPSYRVTGNATLLDATEDDRAGGRTDDQARAKDVESALEDSTVVAVVALRGGAWFTRILPLIDFRVLDGRRTRVAVFGFSELTPLINIVGAHRNGLGVYYMGPAFLTYGLRRHAATHLQSSGADSPTPDQWMQSQLDDELRGYFRKVVNLIDGRHEDIKLSARLVRGELPAEATAAFTGGNLTVLSTMIGSRFANAIDPRGRWLFLEDFNDKPERFDRFLSHLTLARFWERCEGVLLGDFHNADGDLLDTVIALLPYHLPAGRSIPVLATRQVGHIWPMTPMPLHRPATIAQDMDGSYAVRWPGAVFNLL